MWTNRQRRGLDVGKFADWSNRRPLFREELGAKGDDILVGIVGRLTEIKHHGLFLRAVAQFKKDQLDERSRLRVKFVVVGDGSLRDLLEAEARSLELDSDVIFAGNRRDPENFYAALDIVALTSLNEGTPLTLIEAMANERAIIATAVGGVTDLLGDPVTAKASGQYVVCQRGLSVPTNDAEAFAAGLARLINDPQLRQELGDRGLKFVAVNYSKARLLDDIKTLYRQLLESKPLTFRASSSAHSFESRI